MDDRAIAERLAKTYVWWQDARQTIDDPHKLLCQLLRLGRPEDLVTAEAIWGRDLLRRALDEALPGEIDAKSAHFWRLWFDSRADAGKEP